MKKVLSMLTLSIVVLNSCAMEASDVNPSAETRAELSLPRTGPLTMPSVQLDMAEFRTTIETIIRGAVTDVLGDYLPQQSEEIVNIAIRVASRGVQQEHAHQLQLLALQAQTTIDRMRDSHAQELDSQSQQLTETERQKQEIEKKAELRGLLLQVPVVNKELIRIRALNVEQMDVFGRHKIVEELYSRFLPFSELFGRTDLGVIATLDDLTAIKVYMEGTAMMPEPVCPSAAPVLNPVPGIPHSGGELEWDGNWAWIHSAMRAWLQEMGVHDSCDGYDNKKGADSWGAQNFWYNWKPRAVAEYNRRKKSYDEQKREYDAQLARAEAIVFPSDVFNRFVDQVNSFLIEGIH